MTRNLGIVFALLLVTSNQLAAFDQSKDVEGKDCTVIEPLRNYTFNFTHLSNEFGIPVQSSDQPEIFTINFCKSLSRKCNNQTASACARDKVSGKEFVFGFIAEEPIWNEGGIRFSYVGEKCNDKANYTMNVMLHCDQSATKKDYIGAFHISGSCEANIFLRTPLACLPVPDNLKNNKCIVSNPDTKETFNFNSLKNYNHKAAGRNGTTFIIGICNPVLYGHEVACEADSSVCLHDPKAKEIKDQYKNVGKMTEDFTYEKDHISLTMTSSETCEGEKKYSSKIFFECDLLADVSYPTYQGTRNCTHIFSWPTVLACSSKKSCQVTNTETGAIYDFSSLAGIPREAVNQNNTEETFVFSICKQANEPCMPGVGSCVVKNKNNQSTQAGVANDELKLDRKNPYLLFENGASCKTVGMKFTTRIDFICADNAKDEGAVVIEDGCEIIIHYKTMLACDYIKDCVAIGSDDQKIDLSPLIDFEGNYIATVNTTNLPKETSPVKYLLNVCRPLNSKYSLNCRGSAGACRTVIDEKDAKHEQEMNLGHPDYSLAAIKAGDNDVVVMKYFNGDKCPSDPAENTTTKIKFFCNETAGLGNPILQSIDFDCEYSFDFATNIMCNEKTVDVANGSCSLVNEKVGVSMDLKLFGSNGTFKVGDKEVNICGGPDKFHTIVYKQSLIRVEFSQDKIDVVVQLKCSANDKTTSTKSDEGILVMHENPLICRLLKITPRASSVVETDNGKDTASDNVTEATPSEGGLKLGYVFLVSIVVVAFVAFYLVIRNPERREILRNLIKFRSTSSPVQYSRVRLNEESLLLENNAALLSDSDDDNILL